MPPPPFCSQSQSSNSNEAPLPSFCSRRSLQSTQPYFSIVLLSPLSFPLTPPTPIPSFFSLTCGKHYILSGGEGVQTSPAESESLSGRCRGWTGGCWDLRGGDSAPRADSVWTKGGLVISEPQHLIADRLHPPRWTGHETLVE